ncbi:MAG: hypothetical protein RL662_2336 [Bacteroidota bacterium]|jgi:hypothetical protein
MKFDEEFKKAICSLPSKDKDKLLLRLLKHDLNLANQLAFELISGDSVQGRRAKMEIQIKKQIKRMTDTYYSPGYLLVDVRYLSGEITEHVQITRDKYGEASLNLLMMNALLEKNNDRIAKAELKKSYTISIYIIARAFKILSLIKALHTDYLIEFEDGLKKFGKLISDNPILTKLAMTNGFDINWLTEAIIVDDIVAIHKKVRSMGLLK